MSPVRERVAIARGRTVDVAEGAGQRAASLARGAWGQARERANRAREITSETVRILSENAKPELTEGLARLRNVRHPRDAMAAFEDEVGHLLNWVVPVFVANPVPIRDPRLARAVVILAATGAAGTEELEELSLLVSGGISAPNFATVLVFALLALLVEVAMATSLRVHMLQAAEVAADPAAVARDVAEAMLGSKPFGGRLAATPAMVKPVARKVLRRWGAGLVPIAGLAYAAWDSQATIAAIASMPVTDTGTRPALPPGTAPAH